MKGHKKILYLTALCALLTGCSSASKDAEQAIIESGNKISMFVTTDIHYLAESLHDNGPAYQRYLATSDGRQLNYVTEIMDAFAEEVEAQKPDILIVSGDLTNNGEKESHLKLAEMFGEIEQAGGTRVYVIPGNHDIENPYARSIKGEDQYVTDYISSADFETIYGDYGYKEAVSRDKTTLSYLATPSKDVWLLMLDTNVYKTNIKYGAPASYGQIGQETYQWIRECAKLAKENNAQMIAVMHHNLLKHSPVLSYGFTLDNYEEALEVLEECDVKLALSGHIHIQDIKRSRNEEHPIYDVVTSSLCTYPQQYGVLEFDPEQGYDYHTTRVDVASWAKSKNLQNEYLLNFSTNSEKFFADRAYKRIYNQLTETGIYTEYEIELMSDTVSRLNVNYFAGTVPSVREEILESEGYKLWRKATEPERMVTYVNSLVFDYKIDNTKLHISN
ncbi:MAG: hypothetical protein K0S04_475 [Herbinix sp.]|jgi:3',5'-cyclic AMP phosphodiesterase CpdA|nr:hypothetical protein [Herbinix sp.]